MNKTLTVSPESNVNDSELGQKSIYDAQYNPERLYAIPRIGKRQEIGITGDSLPFKGFDCWNHYEVSWLNAKGKPKVAVAEIVYNCMTPYLVESKSLKLYFNSFNNTRFDSIASLEQTITKDLERFLEGNVLVKITELANLPMLNVPTGFDGICLDDLDITCDTYRVEPNYLKVEERPISETVYSNLLKSNCLVTNQPDWGSVQIIYTGKKINHEGLLRYLISFRNHNEFHEQCIERIFMDIMTYCKPETLSVYGRYTRRGGLDINPFRSTEHVDYSSRLNKRLIRQ